MGNIALPHWVVTSGSRCLDHRALCSITVTGKDSILVALTHVKPGSVSLQIMKLMVVARVIPESGLVQQGTLMTPTLVETPPGTSQIMAKDTSKPLGTSWYSKRYH